MQQPPRYAFTPPPNPDTGASGMEPRAPWPTSQPPVQLQQGPGADGPFVTPGMGAGQASPMTIQDGTIGLPGQPLMGLHAYHQVTQAAAAPQAWAYPTPQGMRPLDPTAPTGPARVALAPAPLPVGQRRRIRWGIILPVLWTIALGVAIGLVAHDFDRITGRSTNASTRPKPAKDAVAKDDASEQTLLEQGTEQASRTAALIARIGRERADGRWASVVASLRELDAIAPLSRSLEQLRDKALLESNVDRIIARAGRLHAAGRTDAARALLDRSIARTPHPRLRSMRARLGASTAAPGATGGGGSDATSSTRQRPRQQHQHGHAQHQPPLPGAGSGGRGQQPAPPSNDAPRGRPPVPPPTNPVIPGGGGNAPF